MIESDAIERALADALRFDKAPRRGDDAMLRRLVEGVVRSPAPVPRRVLSARALPVVGAGVAGIAAIVVLAMHHAAPAAQVEASPPVVAQIVEAPAPTFVEAPVATAHVEPAPSATAHPQATAAQLFARANELRRKGHDGEAATTYRTLQQRFPSSPEAIASHMALGRLLLDRRHEPASALDEFDRYLTRGSPGELREEALIGRALSLQQLGRGGEERTAWQTLLAEYPSSMYADQARDRVAALGK